MKTARLLVIVPLSLLLAQCAAGPQRWPDLERRAEDRMMMIQERIGEGLKTGALTPNQGRVHLARLEELRGEYRLMRDKPTYRSEWDGFFRRLDQFEADVSRDVSYPPRIYPPGTDLPPIEDRMISLQRRIDDARSSGRLTAVEGREFQVRLDAIRSDYTRMMEGRPITYEERADVSRRLDLVESDLSRYR